MTGEHVLWTAISVVLAGVVLFLAITWRGDRTDARCWPTNDATQTQHRDSENGGRHVPLFIIEFLVTEIRHRWRMVRASKDAGYTTETVIGIALLAALAIAVIAIIAAKITAKANSINLDGGGGTKT